MKKWLLKTILIFLVLSSCKGANTLYSKDFKTVKKRIVVLQEQFNIKSEILDTEFEIFDVNLNPRSVPGASSREYKVIVKVKPEDIDMWDEPEKLTSFPVDYQWAEELLAETDNKNIKLTGPAGQYRMKDKEMIIFPETGVILIHITQL